MSLNKVNVTKSLDKKILFFGFVLIIGDKVLKCCLGYFKNNVQEQICYCM